MKWFYQRLVRPFLFAQDSEIAHERTLAALSWASRNPVLLDALSSVFESPALPINLFGLSFPNPVGLAAGMDKYATAVPAWEGLGFGFAELGSVTFHSQTGNPAPRVFRAIDSEGLINRMGFNNPGAEALAEKLSEWRAKRCWPNHPIGINLGKSRITDVENAAGDYANSLRALWQHGDFFVINVSSPNTPRLRELQLPAALDEILAAVQEVNEHEAGAKDHSITCHSSKQAKPILLKIAPELSYEALDDLLKITFKRQIAGIVATNTTVTRPESDDPRLQQIYKEEGGLSGRPLHHRSTEVIRHIYGQSCGRLPIIGVGGVFSAEDAWEKITAGASLIQVYTSLVYEGPSVVTSIVRGLRERLAESGFRSLNDAVGKENDLAR